MLACSGDPGAAQVRPTGTADSPCFTSTVEGVLSSMASPEEVSRALLTRWLESFESPGCGEAQLSDFRIDKLEVRSLSEDGMVVAATYSVQPAGITGKPETSPWLISTGDSADGGWVMKKFGFVHISIVGDGTFRLDKVSNNP